MSRTIGLIAAVAVLAAIILILGPAACSRLKSQKSQAELRQGQTEALRDSAVDALAAQSSAAGRERDSEALTISNEKEIQNAEGADDPVNDGVRDAGLRALCLRDAYRGSERCRMLQPHTR